MAQLLVRHLDPAVKEALQRRAQRHGRADHELTPIGGLGTRMAALFEGVGLEDPIQEWGGQEAKSAEWL